jgi:cytoskeleton protein RodZ
MATVLQHPFGTTAFGEFLRSAREKRGLTIQQIANETKIPRRLLESLEHGNLGAVPGMYQRAEIRAYAKAVGLDQSLALSELERALGTRLGDGDRQTDSRDGEGLRQRPWLAAACAVAIAVIVLVTWYGRITPRPSDDRSPAVRADAPTRGTVAGGAKAPPPQQTPAPTPAAPQAQAPALAAQPATTPAAQQAIVAPDATMGAAEGAPPRAGLVTELVVVTDPPGARVIVDGIGRGTTPVTIRYLAAGEKRVRVVKDGFPAQERTVRLAPARQATMVTIPLQAAAQ